MDPPPPPTLYKRKYNADNDEVSPSDLREAYQLAARMVADHGEKYLPLFERLDREMNLQKEREAIKNRALIIANKLKPD